MSHLTVNGVRLNVEVHGNGPAVLLLHGFTGSASTWAPHLDTWHDFTTIAVDLLGHGGSDAPADHRRYEVERSVEDLLGILDQLAISRLAVLGYSMGGRIALQLALHLARESPETLWALALESWIGSTA